MFQPTHPHGVRRPCCSLLCAFPRVSTHAPARGATIILFLVSRAIITFQPTHPHGVRRSSIRRCRCRASFQPTHPHGVRRNPIAAPLGGSGVSTHAPARGATLPAPARRRLISSFNPRTRTGCDVELAAIISEEEGFNPRTRTGCDSARSPARSQLPMFQPTHPHGVRPTRRHWVGA